MKTSFIVNFIGTASPSTIKQLTAITHENGGKWLISKVNFIDNQVAGVIKVEVPQENADVVKNAFTDTTTLLSQITDSDAKLHDINDIFHLRIDAGDRDGIVNQITQVLDSQGISIVDLDCQRVFLAGGGGVSSSLFTAQISLKLPAEVQINDVRHELELLSEDTRVMIEES
ncbi:glycine cleavage system protein R [Vibrio gallicus]|uniref:glycine cleavage system protein R n=1 Tax=Vibrio gallicus TaxID=190897 RepID=UPI0021C49310|nr:ACT domain-containing protein [Vibrio gallicus]